MIEKNYLLYQSMTKRLKRVCVFLSLVLLIGPGCGWFHRSVQADHLSSSPDSSSSIQVISEDRLQRGGRLFIVPFKAGEGVEASEELEKISLMIVKGIGETLKLRSDRWEILSSERSAEAEIILRGHLTQFKKPSRLKKWIFREKNIVLGIEGRLTDPIDGQIILRFTYQKTAPQQNEDILSLDLKIGEEIGELILLKGKD